MVQESLVPEGFSWQCLGTFHELNRSVSSKTRSGGGFLRKLHGIMGNAQVAVQMRYLCSGSYSLI